MIDATDTWVIVLAAFGGGLVGAVVQPLLSYFLELLRSKATIRKTRQRNNRRMITVQIVQGRRVMGNLVTSQLLERSGRPMDPSERFKRIEELRDLPKGYLWQPERVDDEKLRTMLREYVDTYMKLWGEMLLDSPNYEKTNRFSEQLDELQRHITSRMDELNWPEVEE